VTRYLLDTNVISEATKSRPLPTLIEWLGQQDDATLFIATLTLAEIRRGILEKAAGSKRRALEKWFTGPEGPRTLFRGRILSFDEESALEWARLMAEGTALGRPRSAIDMMIAAIASAHRSTVVTLNERHFRGAVAVINPARSAI